MLKPGGSGAEEGKIILKHQFSKRNAFAKVEDHSDSFYNRSHITSPSDTLAMQGFSALSLKVPSENRSFSLDP